MEGGKFKKKLSRVNTRAVSRRQNELVGKFKMAVGDKVKLRLKYKWTQVASPMENFSITVKQ